MKLYVEPMDAVVVEVDQDGRVRYESDGDEAGEAADTGWSKPTLQERRAIIYAAQKELAALAELIEVLE